MPARSKALGNVLNAALKEIGEPEITAISASNILQQRLIEEANNAVQSLVDETDFDWRLHRTTLVTTADVTTGSAAVTNGDATVNSVDSDGVAAENFGSVSAGMYFRADSTQTSYLIDSVDTSGSPDTLELETAYLDSTSTAAGYRIFQDTYAVSTAGFGELVEASYGDAPSWAGALAGSYPDNRLVMKPFSELMQLAGGDRHRDTSGKPRVISEIGPDASNNPQFVLWPYPDEAYLVELWYSIEYAENETFDMAMFGNDAPSSAYDFVEHKVVSAAHLWDDNAAKAAVFEQKAQVARSNIFRIENRAKIDVGMEVEPYRRHYGSHYPGRSGILFDTVLRRR